MLVLGSVVVLVHATDSPYRSSYIYKPNRSGTAVPCVPGTLSTLNIQLILSIFYQASEILLAPKQTPHVVQ